MNLDTKILFISLWIIVGHIYLSDANNNNTLLKVPLIKQKKPTNHVQKREVRSSLGLNSVDDDFYWGPIECGTPGQYLRVIFDTGSSDSWVMSSLICNEEPEVCTSCGHYTYDFRKSWTYEDLRTPWKIEYQDGSRFSGHWIKDNIKVANILIKKQKFAEATYGAQTERCDSYDGIFGLGYHKSYQESCSFRNMMEQHLVDNPVFSFYLNNKDDTSVLLFGGIDRNHYIGNIVYTPCLSDDDWIINCERIYINNQLVMRDSKMLIDSGTSLILCPSEFMNRFIDFVGDSEEIDCYDLMNLPTITFVINGFPCIIKPSQYMIQEPETDEYYEECICGFDNSDLDMFICGTVFMNVYYTVFDMGRGRVGFAKSRP